jgi:hypothetical protein
MEHQAATKTNQPDQKSQATCCAKPASPASEPVHLFRELHQRIGNRAVGRHLQAKMNVSHPHDPDEQEADRVAEQVMRMSDPSSMRHPAIHNLAAAAPQRKCTQCEEKEKPHTPNSDEEQQGGVAVDAGMPVLPPPGELPEEQPSPLSPPTLPVGVQVEPAAQTDCRAPVAPPPSIIGADAGTGGGQPLQASERSFFEPRFGRSFDQVRIHSDGHAAESARALNALAYTVGKDIVFGAGQYVPGSSSGRTLLAHELTHVLQQTTARTSADFSADRKGSVNVQAEVKRMIQRWSADGPAPATTNTIVCDGSGGIRVQIGTANHPSSLPCLVNCLTRHEESHRADALAANAEVCSGAANGSQVNFGPGEQNPSERRASQVEIDCLNAALPTATATCRPIIQQRITQMIAYRDSFPP